MSANLNLKWDHIIPVTPPPAVMAGSNPWTPLLTLHLETECLQKATTKWEVSLAVAACHMFQSHVCLMTSSSCTDPDPVLNPKKKIFEEIQVCSHMTVTCTMLCNSRHLLQPDLHTTDLLEVAYKGAPLMTERGKVTVQSLTKAAVK